MRQPRTISDYLDTLTDELRFDIPLARRVRQEVEDHLWEAAAAGPGDASIEAQHRAIRSFGNPRDIASQYAALSLFRQTRRVGAILILVTAGIFVAMRGRGAWYELVQWSLSDDLRGLYKIGLLIDLYAFRLAFIIGAVGWAYIGSRRVSATFHGAYRDQLKRCFLLCAAAAAPLVASVITDAILTGLRLFDAKMPATALVPMLSMAAEAAFAAVLVVQIRKTIRRAALASSRFCS
jgi:hypothetical protein